MATSGIRRSHSQLTRDRAKIAKLYLKGWLQVEIADELGLNQSTVSRDLAALRDKWQESALVDINEAKSKELAKIDTLEIEYWQAWRRSQEDAVTQIDEKTGTGKDQETAKLTRKQSERRVGQVGDAQFLRGVQWCIEQRCKIFGLEAPKKVNLNDGGLVFNVNLVDNEQE